MEIKENEVKQWLTLTSKFMEAFSYLADSLVLDFYTKSHWKTLPKSWQQFLPLLTPNQLADLIDPETKVLPTPNSTIPPLSLQSFKSSVQLLSLKRTYNEKEFTKFLDTITTETTRDSGLKEFKNLFRRHVKLKKRHEVEQIGRLVSKLSKKTNSTQIYDIGSGQGHSARYLTYEYGLQLTCVDKEEHFGNNASKFDKQLQSLIKKKHSTPLPPPPTHKHLTLEFNTSPPLFNNQQNFGFTGLHSCGNLSPLILHNYVNSSADFVVSLGCCYMKMDDMGFPLSSFTKSLPLTHSYEALEVSCHAIEQYCHRLRSGQVRKLITHSYRATLETILSEHGIHHASLRSVPHTEDLTFEEYATRATKNLNIQLTPMSTDSIKSHLEDWFKVVLFYSLRLMIATVTESSILLDRSLYTSTPKATTYIIPCFDPKTSPRNLGIISYKNSIKSVY